MTSEARHAIESAAKRFPDLGYGGFRYMAYPNEPERQRIFVETDRRDLFDDRTVSQVATCLAYIARVTRIKTPLLGSYHLKHCAERWGRRNGLEPYVSNGSFIVAAIYCDIPMSKPHGPNCSFGFLRRSLDRAAKEGREPMI